MLVHLYNFYIVSVNSLDKLVTHLGLYPINTHFQFPSSTQRERQLITLMISPKLTTL